MAEPLRFTLKFAPLTVSRAALFLLAASAVSGFATYVEAMRAVDLATLTDRAGAEAVVADRVSDRSVRGFLLHAPEHAPGTWGLLFDLWAQAFRHPEVKKDRVALDKQWRDLITRVVRAGIADGEIDELDVEAFTVMWSALLDGLVVQVALDDPLVDVRYAQRVARDVAVKELGLS